jgi:hypothetical protein
LLRFHAIARPLPGYRHLTRIEHINVDRDGIPPVTQSLTKAFRGIRNVSGEDGSSGFRPRRVSHPVRLGVSVTKVLEQHGTPLPAKRFF